MAARAQYRRHDRRLSAPMGPAQCAARHPSGCGALLPDTVGLLVNTPALAADRATRFPLEWNRCSNQACGSMLSTSVLASGPSTTERWSRSAAVESPSSTLLLYSMMRSMTGRFPNKIRGNRIENCTHRSTETPPNASITHAPLPAPGTALKCVARSWGQGWP